MQWGNKDKPKYLGFVFGSEWDKEDFKFFSFRKTPLGWAMNIWRFAIDYDNYANVKPRESR
ncbi:hypothetical protein [Bacillus cereus]|uniref:Uncharacterized protein n=1 Tax=Bacillus cereus HuA3-9 TaxID=1053205 RepID=R8CI77_BACCE|nr:hypothetical protein [Bacillus cereus]EOO11326.1 hypothetical protein IGA_05589 [Bacillus cereus HuA3-9]